MNRESCNACDALCDEEQFNRGGMGYCAECFASSKPAGAVDALAVRAAEILAEPNADRENLAIRIARLEQRDAAVAELLATAKALTAVLIFSLNDPRCEPFCKLVDAIARMERAQA